MARLARLLAEVDTRPRLKRSRAAAQTLIGGYHGARAMVGRGRGRGRVLPDFILIGAAKAGTTSIYGWLCQHPFVARASRKQIHYFDYNYYRGEDWYRKHFPSESERFRFAAEHGRPFLTGEATPTYISHYWAPERVARLLPEVKLLVALRDPVDRAYSHFQMSRRYGDEPLESFERAVATEEARLVDDQAIARADKRYKSTAVGAWSYLMRSRYAEQLERWLRHFDREQLHVVALEELARDPQRAMSAVHAFLGLPDHRYGAFHPLEKATYEPMPDELRAMLRRYFRPHNERLYELVGKDFGWDS